MRIAIYGAGSLGTVLGAYLTKNGVDVDLFSHNKNHVEGLKANGAHIIGKVDFIVKVKAYYPEERSGKYDLIFLRTKQLDNKNVVSFLKEHLEDNGDICTRQNGLPELSVSEIVGEERTMGCAVAWGATLKGNGVSELTSEENSRSFSLGRLNGKEDERLLRAKSILEKRCPVRIESNFIGMRFSKLLINAAFSGRSAVTGSTFGGASKRKDSRLCVQRIIKECIDVAKANDIKIEPIQGKDVVKLLDYKNAFKRKISFRLIPLCIKKHAALKASRLQDLEKGKKTEVDSINGSVVLYGKKKNVPTPYNEKVIEIIHEIEQGKRKPSFDNIKEFESLK